MGVGYRTAPSGVFYTAHDLFDEINTVNPGDPPEINLVYHRAQGGGSLYEMPPKRIRRAGHFGDVSQAAFAIVSPLKRGIS